jgi:hypothetical protein
MKGLKRERMVEPDPRAEALSRPAEPEPGPADAGRRAFLGKAGLVGGALLAAPLLSRPAFAAKKDSHKIRDIERGKLGTTITMELEMAPFPHRSSPYRDATVIVFVPHHFRVRSDYRVDTLVHFHGYRDTARDAMLRHQLREQFEASKQNAIAIFPQGPVRADDMDGGKLDEEGGLLGLLTEVRQTLQTPSLQAKMGRAGIPTRARIGKCILSAHSGGFRVVSYCIEKGGFNVNEVYLFDALYGRTGTFRDWVADTWFRKAPDAERHKLISFYSGDAPTAENKRLMYFFDKQGIEYVSEEIEGSELSKRDITKARAVFIKTSSAHDRVLFRTNALRDCLYASCFSRFLKTDWFKDPNAPRISPGKR